MIADAFSFLTRNVSRCLWIVIAGLTLSGCATAPPSNQSDICEIFRENPSWYKDAQKMNDEFGVPIQISMAFIKQESSFIHDARPPRKYILGFIPWKRPSSAFGYAQAQDPVWGEYQDQFDSWADRDDFGDAIMFVGWYIDGTSRQLGISKWDSYRQYLAYHEGRGGYSRGSYNSKPSLIQVARKVETNANNYGWQLKQCQAELNRKRSWFF
ncbi:MAG: hypothetical protein ACPHV3_00270 [Vibrio sp.]